MLSALRVCRPSYSLRGAASLGGRRRIGGAGAFALLALTMTLASTTVEAAPKGKAAASGNKAGTTKAKKAKPPKKKAAVTRAAVERVANKQGIKILAHLEEDFDGDGTIEFIAACQDDERKVSVCFWDKTPQGPRLKKKLAGGGGNKFKSLKARDLIPPATSQEIILEYYGENPDEKIKRVRVYAGYGTAREIFTSVIFRPKDKSLRADWETDKRVIAYGNARAGWYFNDIDGDGMAEAMVRRKPRMLGVERDGQKPQRLVVGVSEVVFKYVGNAKTGKYRESQDKRFVDFLPAYPASAVRASSTWVPPDILADLEANALAEAVYAASDENGKAPVPEEVVVDRQVYRDLAIDKDLATGWVEDAKGGGLSEWLEVDLGEAREVHMVRLVLGCVADRKTYKRFSVPVKFEISLDGDERTFVNVNEPGRPLKPAVAVKSIPVGGKKFAKQTLVFFSGKDKAQKVRVTILDSKKQGRDNNTCISEIAVH